VPTTRQVNNSPSAVLEREQYLRQAFYGLFKADSANDMHHLNRVICAILQLNTEQCKDVTTRVELLANAIANQNTLETIGASVTGVGSSLSSGISSLSSYWS